MSYRVFQKYIFKKIYKMNTNLNSQCILGIDVIRLTKRRGNHLPLTSVGSNPDRDFGFFHVRKLSS
jgi:hypothetical protein